MVGVGYQGLEDVDIFHLLGLNPSDFPDFKPSDFLEPNKARVQQVQQLKGAIQIRPSIVRIGREISPSSNNYLNSTNFFCNLTRVALRYGVGLQSSSAGANTASGNQLLHTCSAPVAAAVVVVVVVVMFLVLPLQVLLLSLARHLLILLSLMHSKFVPQRLVPRTPKENLGSKPNCEGNAVTADPRTIHHGRLNGVQHCTQTRAIRTWGGIETGGVV
ncbi:MAG: hypothetical protein M1840_005811 [Geoglossum simile]|nr:MAG: hypothetical protein M1840_005811 [Geoglossum simile]